MSQNKQGNSRCDQMIQSENTCQGFGSRLFSEHPIDAVIGENLVIFQSMVTYELLRLYTASFESNDFIAFFNCNSQLYFPVHSTKRKGLNCDEFGCKRGSILR